MQTRLTRRQIAVRLSLSAAAVAGCVSGVTIYRRSKIALESGAPFETFLDLCRALLKRKELDRPTGLAIYRIISSEPYSRANIISLKQALDRGTAIDEMTRDQRWFAEHIVMSWYTGVYFYEGREEQRLAFKQALMNDALSHTVPVPFDTATGYGAWALPPAH